METQWRSISKFYFISKNGEVEDIEGYKIDRFDKNGYPAVTLRYENGDETHYVHRLMAKAFL